MRTQFQIISHVPSESSGTAIDTMFAADYIGDTPSAAFFKSATPSALRNSPKISSTRRFKNDGLSDLCVNVCFCSSLVCKLIYYTSIRPRGADVKSAVVVAGRGVDGHKGDHPALVLDIDLIYEVSEVFIFHRPFAVAIKKAFFKFGLSRVACRRGCCGLNCRRGADPRH